VIIPNAGIDVAVDRCGDSGAPGYRAQVANIVHRYPSFNIQRSPYAQIILL
jgi:hypothetical protein